MLAIWLWAQGSVTLGADNSKQLGGWNLDDVCIVGIGKLARCGDHITDDNETCDDGNLSDGDGCAADCTEEFTAGGGCCAVDSHSASSLFLGAFVIAIMRRKRRA